MSNLYVDGGVIGRNPSSLGGTWAWCLIDGKEIIGSNYGVIEPSPPNPEKITNNFTELLAAIKGLRGAGPEWNGTLYTDSKVTLHRLLGSFSFKNIPNWLRVLTLDLRRNRKWDAKLVGGHPTKKELEMGHLRRNSLPTSRWNVWCDNKCREAAREFLDLIPKDRLR